jgi:hypothetical protein
MGKLVKKDGKFLKKDGKFVKTDNIAECSCCGDGPCPPGKYCTWIPPDPCSTGKCQPDRIDDNPFLESQCGDAPYDCRSEEACNQWYEQNPNPPCDCWFCEDGVWVNKPSLDCANEGGTLGPEPPAEDCKPPPPPCGDCVPIPGITSLKLEVKGDEVCVLATAQWTPPEGCYESDQEARDKVSITFEFLDKDRQVVQSIGGPANIGDNTVGYCNSLTDACDPSSKKAEFVRAKAVSQECESKWSPEKGLSAGSPNWEQVCEPPPPCPPGKFCSWTPPDPCATGDCTSFESDDPIECPEGFPYDCTSKEACNQWYAAHPNPPCDCWFCEDGTWVNKPSLNCINEGGTLGPQPPAEDCKPPPPTCEDITCTAWEPSQDADGKDCCKRQCCKAELKPDVNGDLTCVCVEDQYEEISYDLTLCGGEPPSCEGESEQGTWQLELCDEEDCKYVTCGQGGSGVGPKFLTQQACRDCHNLRETCSLDHPLCVLNRNPLP